MAFAIGAAPELARVKVLDERLLEEGEYEAATSRNEQRLQYYDVRARPVRCRCLGFALPRKAGGLGER